MVRVVVPVPPEERVTLVELSESVGPGGELAVERVMVSAKPPRLFREIVDAFEEPGEIVTEEMLKSGAGDVGLKNSVMAVAPASLDVSAARFQLISIVLVSE